MVSPLLSVEALTVAFRGTGSPTRAVEGVAFEIAEGSTVGLVGESGSGKSVTALAILRLLPEDRAHVESGAIRFRGRDLLKLRDSELQGVRGNEISMIFQEPMTSLNPIYRIGNQVAEVVRIHRKKSRAEALERAIEMLTAVGIADARAAAQTFPHELSGGMRQRVMIAMALACDPALLLADEPTTALDVTTQASIIELLKRQQREKGLSILFVTHDLPLVREISDTIVVMYAGEVVESGPTEQVFRAPRHPYTKGLIASIPRGTRADGLLPSIPGQVPARDKPIRGCRFAPRCPLRAPVCTERPPQLVSLGEGRASRCYFPEKVTL